MKSFSLYFLTFVTGASAALFAAKHYPDTLTPDISLALQQCLSEVEKGCPLLTGYAISLEKENARLNRAMLHLNRECSKTED